MIVAGSAVVTVCMLERPRPPQLLSPQSLRASAVSCLSLKAWRAPELLGFSLGWKGLRCEFPCKQRMAAVAAAARHVFISKEHCRRTKQHCCHFLSGLQPEGVATVGVGLPP